MFFQKKINKRCSSLIDRASQKGTASFFVKRCLFDTFLRAQTEVQQQIKDAGMRAGVTLNPSTPVSMLTDIISDVDMVLLMSVHPGFGGQKFIPHTLTKVRELRELIDRSGSQALIEVDGGVNLETGSQLVEAGADVLVAGNAVFKAPDMVEMIRRLKELK